MSKRITITLTDDEYAALEKHAGDERRAVRDMAAYLVVKHTPPVVPILSVDAGSTITGPFKIYGTGTVAAPSVPLVHWGTTTVIPHPNSTRLDD